MCQTENQFEAHVCRHEDAERVVKGQAPALISIVIATFNAAAVLERCLKSISSQTYPRLELILIDGGSTDATLEVVNQWSDHVTYWESEKDRGIYHAWNKGLAHAKGEWICFLGADDYLWSSDTMDIMAQSLLSVPANIDVAYGQVAIVSQQGRLLDVRGRPWEKSKHLFIQEMTIPHPGLFHRRTLFERVGNFDESFRIAGDYELLLRELKERDALFLGETIVVGMQHGGTSMVSRDLFRLLRENQRAREKNGIESVPNRLRLTLAAARTIGSNCIYRWLGKNAHRRVANIHRVLTNRPLR